jgi:FXSXX-COOH protein
VSRSKEVVVGLDESADVESDLVDVAGIDLEQLAGLPDSVLANSLRRILDEGEKMSDQYAIFQNAIG